MPQRPIERSESLEHATARFLDDLRTWVYACIARYENAPATDVHDQGTYATGWLPYIQATDDGRVVGFLHQTRDRIRAHFEATDQWRHGYWRMHEVHHGTEHFELFLGMLARLDPADAETARQLQDVAEHMGNWSPAVEPWFDRAQTRFRSLYFGADGVRLEPGMTVNTPDHMRGVNICLLAADCNSREAHRYREFARHYAGAWADAILAGPHLPLALTADGALDGFDDADEQIYRSFMGEASALALDVDRAENILGSDGINTFLRLWQASGEPRLRRAAERLLDVLVTQLADPDAGAAADAVRAYRGWTGDTRYDAAVRDAVAVLDPWAVTTLTLDTDFRLNHRPSGVGKRSDMPGWLEDGAPRRHSPITLSVAAEISGDDALMTWAVDLARAYFLLAREAFPDGRDHGCAARTVSAIARGHSRENHAGMTTAVLAPALARLDVT